MEARRSSIKVSQHCNILGDQAKKQRAMLGLLVWLDPILELLPEGDFTPSHTELMDRLILCNEPWEIMGELLSLQAGQSNSIFGETLMQKVVKAAEQHLTHALHST